MYQNQYNSATSAPTATGSSYSTHQYYQYPYQYQNYYGYQPPPPPPPTGQPSQPPPPPPPTDQEDTQVGDSSRLCEPPPPGTTDGDDLKQETDVASSSGQAGSSEYAETNRSSTPSKTDTVPYSDAPTATQSDTSTANSSSAGWGSGSGWDTNTQSQWSQQGTWNTQGQYGTPQSWQSNWHQQHWSQSPTQSNWTQSTSQQNWQQQQQQQAAWSPDKQKQQQTTQQSWSTTQPTTQQGSWTPQQGWQQQQSSQAPQSRQQTPTNQSWTPQQGWPPQQWTGWGQWSSQNWPSQSPGVEAWAGQQKNQQQQQQSYQNFYSGSKSNYSYQQQTDYSKQGPPSSDPNKQITTTIQSELKPPRSPGTPPLTDLLPSGGPANDDPNDRVVPPVGGEKRKRYPSDYHEIPEVKRQHYGSDVGVGGVGHGVGLGCGAGRGNVGRGRGSVGRGRGSVGRGVGRGSRWDNPEKKQKKTLLATPAYHAVPPPGQVERPYPSNQQSPPASVHPLNQRAPPAPKLSPKEKNPTPSSRTPDKWPPRFREYVFRAFQACHNDEERNLVHQYLDVELNKMFEEERQWAINWDTYPSPLTPDKQPPRFREYVFRAFQACHNDEERNLVHQYLDVELNKVFEEKRQWTINWDLYPSPLELRKAKAPSRWDTPSPSTELRTTPPKKPLQVNSDDEQEFMSPSFGRGRGRKRKRQKKKGKNKFFIDNEPSPGFVMTPEDRQKMNQRSNRFGKDVGAKTKKLSIDELLKANSMADEDGLTWQDKTLEGTSKSLEKQYLRLTSAPDRNTVRPVRVLKLSLKHVMDKWESERDYHYTCEQLKSIRQDLTIQTVRDNFTVLVYETHARVALRNGDRGEFNQCQAQLKSLYAEGVPGNQTEFIAYRILYLMLTQNTADMCAVLRELTYEQRHTSCVKHALSMFSTWSLGNYHQFFKLYKNAPNLSGAVIDMFLERERTSALKTISKAYRPNIKVSFLTDELGFDSTEDCVAFLNSVEAVLDSSNTMLDCKLTQPKL